MRPIQSSNEHGASSKSKWLFIRRPLFVALAAFCFYAVLASIATFPFVIKPSNTITAPLGGDLDGSVAKFEALREGHQVPFFATHFPAISYPEGPQDNIGVDRVSFFSTLYLWLASDVFGAITAHSLMSFLGYVLTGFVTYLFVRRITGSSLAGLIAGFAYGFSPTMYAYAGSDMTYTAMWLFILPLWAFWVLAADGFSRRRAILAALSIVPAVFWTPYYTLQCLIVGASSLAVTTVYLWKRYGWRLSSKFAAFAAIVWLLVIAAWRYIGLHTASTIIPVRTITQIYQQSAQPLEYLLPGKWSWGVHGNALLTYLDPQAATTNLYLGLSVIVLAAVGLILLFGKRGGDAATDVRMKIAALMASAAGFVCLLFSLPPTYSVGGVRIPMPSDLVAHFIPALRAGQRFVMPIMGCTAILAGIGVWLILKRVRPKWRVLVAIGIFAIMLLDLWALPPRWTTTIPPYASLTALRELPTAPVAQFDNGSLLNAVPQMPCLLQHEYDKPLINDCGLGRSPDLGRILVLPLCDQISALQAMGTEYVILSPHDQAVLSCMSSLGATHAVISRDSVYEVLRLNTLSPELRAATKARLKLP